MPDSMTTSADATPSAAVRASAKYVLITGLILVAGSALATGPADPFLWLEDIQGKAALEWVEDENRQTLERLTADPRYPAIYEAALKRMSKDNHLPGVNIIGKHVYDLLKNEAQPLGIWRRMPLEQFMSGGTAWEPVLDMDAFSAQDSAQKNWLLQGSICWEERCLLALSPGGSDAAVYREFDLEKKAFVPGGFELPQMKSAVAWIDHNTVIFAAASNVEDSTTAGYASTAKLWKRGTPFDQAKTIFEVPVEHNSVRAFSFSEGSRKHVLLRDDLNIHDYVYHLVTEDGEVKKLNFPPAEVFDLATAINGKAVGVLKKDWIQNGTTFTRGSLIALDFAGLTQSGKIPPAETLFVPEPHQSINSVRGGNVVATGKAIYLNLLDNVAGKLVRIAPSDGGWVQSVLPVPDNGTIRIVGGDDENDTLFVTHQSFLTPPRLLAVKAGQQISEIQAIAAEFDAEAFETVQHFAPSSDGVRVPYFVTRPKVMKMDGSAPAVVVAYGGFGVTWMPTYLGSMFGMFGGESFKAMLQAGGISVLANLRGGGAYGPDWHQAAMLKNRQKSYDDYYAVAEDLIRRGYTSPRHLGIAGASNGGLLVGTAFTQRPDLYNAVICGVPLLDMKRYSKLLAGASWMGEYGDPDDPEMWEVIKRYSPYQNLRPEQKYPEVFLFTSTNDDRVHPGHARKMAAMMKQQGHPYLYFENTEGGHHGSANHQQVARLEALRTVYLLQKLL